MPRPWLEWRARALGTVRARLTGLLGLAAVPVVALAAILAWQNYRLVVDRALREAVSVRTAEIGHGQATLDGLEQLLAALSAMPVLEDGPAAACNGILADVLRLQPARYVNLVVLTPDGKVRCSALPPDRDRGQSPVDTP